MNARIHLVLCIVATLSVSASAADFQESWENAVVGVYAPSTGTFIEGDEGEWLVEDEVSRNAACGPTPQRAEIFQLDGHKVLQLTSNDSNSECSDIVSVKLAEFDSQNRGFAIPITTNTIISFEEVGELTEPGPPGTVLNRTCLNPPCFDNVSLLLTDNHGNTLAYVLQRSPKAVPNVTNRNRADTFREVFLDPDAVNYRRNLFEDFQTIPAFRPTGANIRTIEFRVDEHGSAMIDNLIIESAGPVGTVPVFRFWSPVLHTHFFTADAAEAQGLMDRFPGIWDMEGIAFFALPSASNPNARPVFRFWSPVLSAHFYTIDEAERDKLINNFPDVWTFEGIAFFAFPEGLQPSDSSPVFRFRSDPLGDHFYTISRAERDKVLILYPTIWTFEGIAWFAFPPAPSDFAAMNLAHMK
jgi:hypothetical protein